ETEWGTLDDADEEIGIGLLARTAAPIALGVGHGAAEDEVLALERLEEAPEPRVVLGAVRLVALVGDGVEGVEGVHAHAALEAGAGELTEAALHLVLRHHVLGALGHVEEAAHAVAEARAGDARELGLGDGQVVGGGHGLDRRADQRVVDGLLDLLAEDVDVEAAPAERADVVFTGQDRHGRSSLSRRAPPGASMK